MNNRITSIYLACFHSEARKSLRGCSDQYLAVEQAIKVGEWPYDNGDDPSFFVARRGGLLTWGVCRQDLRNSIKQDSIVVFFSYTPISEKTISYRLCAVATVADKLDHRAVHLDSRFAKFRDLYINTLIRSENDGWRYSELDRPPAHRHKDWLWRMSSAGDVKKRVFRERYASIYRREWFRPAQNGVPGVQLGENYVVFHAEPGLTFIPAVPPEVATAVKGHSEKWTDPVLKELTVRTAKRYGARDNLRVADSSGYPHRHIRFKMPTDEAVEWRRALIASLRERRQTSQARDAEKGVHPKAHRRSSC